ncbi:hypothetical protein EYF80_000094 [Liparis tanakae]|uniref:Uncharacterized protein n=1 Tax=Liparis tanakae TaxID=230148 RepID=A0A4Z2JHU7_9TELE|nr:hypothetical protein EYF80_000094 [Liparis tanakae]
MSRQKDFRAFRRRVPEKHTEASGDWSCSRRRKPRLPAAGTMAAAPGCREESLKSRSTGAVKVNSSDQTNS